MAPFWATVRGQLDRNRERRPATVKRPSLDPASELALRSLLGDGYRSRIELDVLERELVVRRIGLDLDDVLTQLGHPPSVDAEVRRVDATRRRQARAALDAAVDGWEHPWSRQWASDIVASGNLAGLEPDEVTALTADVAKVVLLVTTSHGDLARVDAAALLFGDAHALDPGLRRTTWVARALRHIVDGGDGMSGRDLWAAAGLAPDRVSGPALVWGLEAFGDAPAVDLLAAAARRRVPVHLSTLAMDGRIVVREGSVVLVAENPRVVEYASEHRAALPVIATNGNPSTAVQMLVDRLLWSGADVRYHGDFDSAGLAIAGRMYDRGCRPWRMGAADYEAALASALSEGVQLDRDERRCGATPWDPDLATVFNRDCLIVHEEFVLPTLL